MIPEIANRRSVRKYLARPVGREKILSCLESARVAPSACNKQPWRFMVVDDPRKKEGVCRAAFRFPPAFNAFALQAPVIIVVIADVDFMTHQIFGGIQGVPYYLLDIGAAIENFMLQAVSEGLGTCWLGWFDERAVKIFLKLSPKKKIVSLLTLGYPADGSLPEKSRKPLGDICVFDSEN